MTNCEINVAETSPKIMALHRGIHMGLLSERGIRPTTVVIVVLKIGRRRSAEPLAAASLTDSPASSVDVHGVNHDNGIVNHDAHQGNNTNHGRKRKGNPCQKKAPESADHGKRKGQHDNEWLRKGTELQGQ